MSPIRDLARRDGTPRRPRVAFVLSGGGNLGAIQVGMLRALAERSIVPDVVLGCSIGALNGAAFAAAPSEDGVAKLEDHWLHATDNVMPSSRIPSAVQLLRKGASLHRNEGLRQGIEALLGERREFEDLELAFQCVAVDVDRAVESWFDRGALVSAILASAALPAVYPPVVIEGRRYVDGGVVDNVPIARAVELGCRTIYVLQLGPHGRPAEIKRPLDGALMAYWVARNSRFARDLASLPTRVEAVILPPGERPDLKYDDFSRTAELVAQGYRNSARFLDERADQIGERRRPGELLAPIGRLVLSARSRSLRRAQQVAESPEGAILTGDDLDDEAVGGDAPRSLAGLLDGAVTRDDRRQPKDTPDRDEATSSDSGTSEAAGGSASP